MYCRVVTFTRVNDLNASSASALTDGGKMAVQSSVTANMADGRMERWSKEPKWPPLMMWTEFTMVTPQLPADWLRILAF